MFFNRFCELNHIDLCLPPLHSQPVDFDHEYDVDDRFRGGKEIERPNVVFDTKKVSKPVDFSRSEEHASRPTWLKHLAGIRRGSIEALWWSVNTRGRARLHLDLGDQMRASQVQLAFGEVPDAAETTPIKSPTILQIPWISGEEGSNPLLFSSS